MAINSEGHQENPIHATQLFTSLGKGEFIPSYIQHYSADFKPKGDSFDPDRESLMQAVQRFIAWAPSYLQDQLFYTPFCKKEGLMIEGAQQKPITPFERQTSAGLAADTKWQEFMASHTPPPETMLKAVKEIILNMPVRNALYDPLDIQLFDKSMRIGGHTIALALIPNLTDQEVKYLFGQQASLAEIQKQTAMQ